MKVEIPQGRCVSQGIAKFRAKACRGFVPLGPEERDGPSCQNDQGRFYGEVEI